MARTQKGFRCTGCGWESPGYVGRCQQCGEWNTLEQFTRASSRAPTPFASAERRSQPVVELSDVSGAEGDRFSTAIEEFDRVLGGGIVPGSLALVGGDPGVGKSTLMLQAAAYLARDGRRVAYVCGEESPRQVRLRANRLAVDGAGISLIAETSLDAALAAASSIDPDLLIVDSIQSVYCEGIESRLGAPAQLGEAGARLLAWAKNTETATFMTGHVTKAGEVAGPRLLEHLVDVVLYFEAAEYGALRLLRATKNRFGATDEVGVFEMTGAGLASIENPSAAFLDRDAGQASGCAVTAVIEGSRPLALEVQALAVSSSLAVPRRVSSGIENARLHLLLAVLARRAGLAAGEMDVVATVAGGLRLRDPGADLAVAVALASAIRDRPVEPGLVFLGEVALSGSIRPAAQAQRRLAELARMGYRYCLAAPGVESIEGIEASPVQHIREAITTALT